MNRFIFLSGACPALQYFFQIIPIMGRFSKKKKKSMEHKMCVFYFLYNCFPETFLIPR